GNWSVDRACPRRPRHSGGGIVAADTLAGLLSIPATARFSGLNMNTSQLRKLGVPDACLNPAIQAIQAAAKAGGFKGSEAKRLIRSILETPDAHTDHPSFGPFARALIEERDFVPPPPVEYRTWGTEIDNAAHAQMRQSCQVPVARGAALMADAHVGYGLPIGGVLA